MPQVKGQALHVRTRNRGDDTWFTGGDFLSDVHFLNLVDFLNVRLVHCACANNTCQA